MKPNSLALRRDRRILRSKVYILLKDSPQDAKLLDILEEKLNPKELEDVIEDALYFVPFPDKLEKLLNHSRSIEELVDNTDLQARVKIKQRQKVRRRFPSILLPKKRDLTLKPHFNKISPKINYEKSKIEERSTTINKWIKKIDSGNPLISKCLKINRSSDSKLELYKNFYDKFITVNEDYHLNLKKQNS